MLIVDELGVLGGGAVTNLIERVREAGVGVIVSAQTVAGLGDDAAGMLEAVDFRVVHRTANPQQLINLAGTVQDGRRSYSVTEDRFTGHGQWAERDRWRVDPNTVRQLPRGEAVVIAGGRACRTLIRPPDSDELGVDWLTGRRPTVLDAEPSRVEVVAVERDEPVDRPASWVK